MSNPIQFDHLAAGQLDASRCLVHALSRKGFARVALAPSAALSVLERSVQAARQMTGFRFPPIDSEVRYAPIQRSCFEVLFHLTRGCLGALLSVAPVMTEQLLVLQDSLVRARSPEACLFGIDGVGHSPFQDPGSAFSSSFFNLFHYDHGLLNVHRDRCLVTAIFADVPKDTASRSALWVRDSDGAWTNVDAILGAREIVILVGEDMEHIAQAAGMPLYAAEHCIRVDPDGENLSRAHFRPDPATHRHGNRASAAFILSESKVAQDEF